jgi:hypothetical protein
MCRRIFNRFLLFESDNFSLLTFTFVTDTITWTLRCFLYTFMYCMYTYHLRSKWSKLTPKKHRSAKREDHHLVVVHYVLVQRCTRLMPIFFSLTLWSPCTWKKINKAKKKLFFANNQRKEGMREEIRQATKKNDSVFVHKMNTNFQKYHHDHNQMDGINRLLSLCVFSGEYMF